MATKNEIAVKKETPVSTNVVYDYGADAGGGFEGTTASDLSIPFLQLLQANSPQVADDTPSGSRPGMFYNTVTKTISGSVNFLPVHFLQMYVEWTPRDAGGGFVAAHSPDTEVVRQALGGERMQGKILLPNGNELIETHYAYGLILDETGEAADGFAVIGFTSTKIKVFRDWKTAMYMVKGKPPLYAFRARLTSIKQQNEKGTYYNIQVTPHNGNWVGGLINPVQNPELWESALGFRGMVQSGQATAAYETQGTNEAGTTEGKAPF